jgi:hypothetical protein
MLKSPQDTRFLVHLASGWATGACRSGFSANQYATTGKDKNETQSARPESMRRCYLMLTG